MSTRWFMALGRSVLLVPVVATLLSSCDDGTAPTETAPPVAPPLTLTADQQRLVSGSNGLAMGLFRIVQRAAGSDSNVFISPLSASQALGMAALGANGSTLDSMRAVLGFPGVPVAEMAGQYQSLLQLLESRDPQVTFRPADAIWISPLITVLAPFTATAEQDFGARVGALDFTNPSAPSVINRWVDSATDGHIRQLVSSLPPNMRVFLANAIYFHGAWRQRFNPGQTVHTTFTTSGGAKVPVRLMLASVTEPATVSRDYVAVDLPYGNGAFAMTVVVPVPSVSLDSLVHELADGGWGSVVAKLDSANPGNLSLVSVAFPTFTLTWGDSLRSPLSALGMGIAFSDAADFSHLSTTPLRIDGVFQRTYVSVDEQGTTAAAATGVGAEPTALRVPLVVRADHPFVYAVRERSSGAVLFIGAFAHPVAQ